MSVSDHTETVTQSRARPRKTAGKAKTAAPGKAKSSPVYDDLTARCERGLWLTEDGSAVTLSDTQPGETGGIRILGIYKAGTCIVAALAYHSHPEYSAAYMTCAVLRNVDGQPVKGLPGRCQRAVVKKGAGDKPSTIIWYGEITVTGVFRVYDGDSARNLKPAEYHQYIRIRTVNEHGHMYECDIAATDTRKAAQFAQYHEKLGIGLTLYPDRAAEYCRMLARNAKRVDTRIHGQGPYHADDGTDIFVCKSFTLDTNGKVRNDIRSDGNNLGIYDLTPPDKLDNRKVQQGIFDLAEALSEIPGYEEIPAALHGQQFISPFMAIDARAFAPIVLPGVKGSGKTRLMARYDAMQSRTARSISQIKPALNLGDYSGTSKGPKYRVGSYGGFSIAIDDLLKSTDSKYRRDVQQETLSNLIRSYESGAGALGRVNKAENRVEASESGTLHSNPRVTSEVIPDPGSTMDRVILLPRLNQEYSSGPFDRPLSAKYNVPETLERLHHAYSSYVIWAWAHRDMIFDDLRSKALAETDGWELVNARVAERYAAVITGLYAFDAYAVQTAGTSALAGQVHAAITAGIGALRRCATGQLKRQEPLSVMLRDRLRQMLTNRVIAFPGMPTVGPDGSADTDYTLPWIMEKSEDDGGITTVTTIMPPGVTGYQDIGMSLGSGKNPEPAKVPDRTSIAGYMRPPIPKGTGTKRTATADEWVIVIPTANGMFDNLCSALTKFSRDMDGHAFTNSEVIETLTSNEYGEKRRTRTHIDPNGKTNAETCVIIKASYLFTSEDN